jgi:HPr kinase/phosphorylase
MADSYSLDALIGAHQQALSFSWLTPSPDDALSATADMTYWLGEYAPQRQHAIEIIVQQNLSLFAQALQQNRIYSDPTVADARPQLIIFADSVPCDPQIQANLQAHGLAAVCSPAPAKLILRELAYTLAQAGLQQTRHGVMLSIYDRGIFLTGRSGIGKSALALELLTRGHRLVADDAPLFHRLSQHARVYALCPPLLADFLEVRALGILDVCKLFDAQASAVLMPVDLIIELVDSLHLSAEQRLQPYARRANILGVDIPSPQIPINHSANLALIVETLTKNHVLYQAGDDAGVSLSQRQQQTLYQFKQTV